MAWERERDPSKPRVIVSLAARTFSSSKQACHSPGAIQASSDSAMRLKQKRFEGTDGRTRRVDLVADALQVDPGRVAVSDRKSFQGDVPVADVDVPGGLIES